MAYENVLPMEGSSRVLLRTDHHIGAILVEEGKLKPSDIQRIIDLHHQSGMRFGEAAQRLGLLDADDLTAALNKQYDLPRLLPASESSSSELVAAHLPLHSRTEEIRGLRTQLLLRWLDPAAGRRVLAVTSPGNGDGRSYVAANLAVVFSQLGLRTLLIDADLRSPRQHKIFNLPDRIGLAGVLAGRDDSAAVVPVPGISKLFLLPAGAPPPNPQELLSRPALASLLDELTMKFDLILIDTSAAKVFSDAKTVAFRAKNALVLARKNHTLVDDTRRMIRELSDTGTRVVGTVINAF
jgi:chain length determinant protein tyrosine kinase EpsG